MKVGRDIGSTAAIFSNMRPAASPNINPMPASSASIDTLEPAAMKNRETMKPTKTVRTLDRASGHLLSVDDRANPRRYAGNTAATPATDARPPRISRGNSINLISGSPGRPLTRSNSLPRNFTANGIISRAASTRFNPSIPGGANSTARKANQEISEERMPSTSPKASPSKISISPRKDRSGWR